MDKSVVCSWNFPIWWLLYGKVLPDTYIPRLASMKNKLCKWCVVVGQPKKAYWGKRSANMANVGKVLLGIDGSPLIFQTRKVAREKAKQESKDNLAWNYHAKKC